MKNEIIYSYREEDSRVIEYSEIEDIINWDNVCFVAGTVLETKDYVRIVGNVRCGNDSNAVDQIIRENALEDVINKYLNIDLNIDGVEVDVYQDRVELVNTHHNGTNHYTFYPLNLRDMKKAQLLSMIDEDDYKHEYGRNPKYEDKSTLINFIEERMI